MIRHLNRSIIDMSQRSEEQLTLASSCVILVEGASSQSERSISWSQLIAASDWWKKRRDTTIIVLIIRLIPDKLVK